MGLTPRESETELTALEPPVATLGVMWEGGQRLLRRPQGPQPAGAGLGVRPALTIGTR